MSNARHRQDRGFGKGFGGTLRVEDLEQRLVLSSAQMASVYAFGHPDQVRTMEIATAPVHAAATNTISGHVLNQNTGKGVARVKVELINSDGLVAKATTTNAKGAYSFKVTNPGPYVVAENVPRKFTQVLPSFNVSAPVGSYLPGFGASSWNYATGNSDPANGPVGAPFWSNITTVGQAPFESPINIHGPSTDLGQYLAIHYAAATPTKIINNSHQIQLQFPANTTADTITLGGQTYSLSQFHYHDPSENQVNGQSDNMEEHFVNVSASGATTVLAVFLQLGAHNSALDPILNAATSSLTAPNSSTTISTPIDFSGLLPTSKQGWFFEGSLTTPPLSVGVNWLVFANPITLDAAQLKQYEAVASGAGFLPNNRPIQPTDGRVLNQFNIDVNYQGTAVAGLDFGVAPVAGAKAKHRA